MDYDHFILYKKVVIDMFVSYILVVDVSEYL